MIFRNPAKIFSVPIAFVSSGPGCLNSYTILIIEKSLEVSSAGNRTAARNPRELVEVIRSYQEEG